MLVNLAQTFEAEIRIESDSSTASAKSLMGLLTLNAQHGTELTVTADGQDADKAVRAIKELFARGLREKEREWQALSQNGPHSTRELDGSVICTQK